MTKNDAVRLWQESAERNVKVAEDSLKLKHYDWALFFYQLVLEKVFKSLVIKKTNKAPPPIHDLVRLAEAAGVELSLEQKKDLEEITTFNVEARYDVVKLAFYRKTRKKDYTDKWIKKCRQYYQWLKSL
jgi:HEPN domain-containing protein